MNIPWYRKVIYSIIAPVIIVVFCVTNPRRVWLQAKKEFGIDSESQQ